jgi:hypothetical protein
MTLSVTILEGVLMINLHCKKENDGGNAVQRPGTRLEGAAAFYSVHMFHIAVKLHRWQSLINPNATATITGDPMPTRAQSPRQ